MKADELIDAYAHGQRDFSGANLSNAYLRCTNLRDANLRDADLRGADLSNADLRGADLSNAYLRCTNLRNADLRGADLFNADLHGADLFNANLFDANLSGANLSGARGVVSFGPVGQLRRIGCAVSHDGGPRIQLGCFWGTLDAACAAIRDKYGDGSAYENLVRAACAALEEEIKR